MRQRRFGEFVFVRSELIEHGSLLRTFFQQKARVYGLHGATTFSASRYTASATMMLLAMDSRWSQLNIVFGEA
jgi:hypothetical protein